ncbi:MAG: DUF3563 domain-containing protein [Fulvimarina sp.]|nr:DUF3563 domain-containing protein [Fulvimarina sp.]
MKITQTLRTILGRTSRQSRERSYLEQSVSMADLERRQREIERGLFQSSRNIY